MQHATEWKRKLTELATGKVLFDECMDRHTSIGVGGRADALVFPGSIAELGKLVAVMHAEGSPSSSWATERISSSATRGSAA
jgi:hypothetical protein